MPVTLEGSCNCKAVTFSVASNAPYPYQLCYCSICRKAGTGGYAINLLAQAKTLKVTGAGHVSVFRAAIATPPYNGAQSPCERRFCKSCGTMLWVQDPRWPDLLHPFASAIDTDLPAPPERVHVMLGSKADWVRPDIRPEDQSFTEYPDQSIEDWHKGRGLWIE